MLKKIVKMLMHFPENCIFVKVVAFGARQLLEQVLFLRAILPLPLLKHFSLFQSNVSFNFVETHVFTKLDISLHIYFSFASLVHFLGPEISVWKFWPKIPLTLCTKLWGPVAPPKLFSIFFILCRYDFITKMNKMRGCPEEKYHLYF